MSVNCIEKTKIKKKKPAMAHFTKVDLGKKYFSHFCTKSSLITTHKKQEV